MPDVVGDVDWNALDTLAQRDLPAAIEQVNRLCAGELSEAEAFGLRVVQLEWTWHAGRAEEARKRYQELLEELPRSKENAEWSGWLQEGLEAQANRDPRAAQHFAQASERAEQSGETWIAAWLLERAAWHGRESAPLDVTRDAYNRAAQLWEEAGDAYAAFRIRLHLGYLPGGMTLSEQLEHVEASIEILSKAERWRDLALAHFFGAFIANEPEVADAGYQRSIQLADRAGDEYQQISGLITYSQFLAYQGDPERGIAVNDQAMARVSRVGPFLNPLSMGQVRATVLAHLGTPEALAEATTILRPLVLRAEEEGLAERLCYLRYQLARCLLAQGEPQEAEQLARLALAFLEERGDRSFIQEFLQFIRRTQEAQERWQDALITADRLAEVRMEFWRSGEAERISLGTARQDSELRKVRLEVVQQEKALAESRLILREKELQAALATEARERSIRRSAIVLLVGALGATLVLAVLYRQKRKAERQVGDLVALLEGEKAQLAVEVGLQRRLSTELEETNERLREIDAHRRQILSVAAHDMRNPLGAIEQCLDLLSAELAPPAGSEAQELLELSRSSVTYLNELLEQIVDARRDEERALHLTMTWLDPASILNQIAAFNEIRAQQKGMSLAVQIELERGTQAWGDASSLRSCLDNLFSNAIKFSPQGSSVTARLEERNNMIRISVEDEGPGLAESDFPQLFREFGQLSAKTTGGEASTGLGLHGVKQKMVAMGGRVFAENREPRGARFILELKAGRG